jgi:hypothetical protein
MEIIIIRRQAMNSSLSVDWIGIGMIFFSNLSPTFILAYIDACSLWNRNQTIQCVGISWDQANYGPAGPSGGSQCFLKWQTPGDPIANSGSDDARLRISSSVALI